MSWVEGSVSGMKAKNLGASGAVTAVWLGGAAWVSISERGFSSGRIGQWAPVLAARPDDPLCDGRHSI